MASWQIDPLEDECIPQKLLDPIERLTLATTLRLGEGANSQRIELHKTKKGDWHMLNRITIALVMVLLCAWAARLPAAAEQKDDAAKKELEKFQGTWKFVSMEEDGKQAPKSDAPNTITFTGDKFAVKMGDKVVQAGTQKLDPGKKPKTVDAAITEGEGKGTTMLGIYELEGDTLKACFDPQGKKRPTEFKTTPGSGYFLAIIKRAEKK